MPDEQSTIPPQSRLTTGVRRGGVPGIDSALEAEGAVAHLRWTPHGVVVEVCGEVDATFAPRAAQVRQLLTHWTQGAVVDARGVTFVDLTGLDALCTLAQPGGPVLVLQPSDNLLRLLRLLALAGCGPPVQALGQTDQAIIVLSRSGANGSS